MKVRYIISWCLIAIVLCSCTAKKTAENKRYEIYQKDGVWYMKFDPNSTGASGQSSTHAAAVKEYPRFETVSDMQSKINSGDIPERQIAALQTDSTDHLLKICNPNELHDLALPSTLAYDYILWYGSTYSFEFAQGAFMGYVVPCDEETFNRQFAENYGPLSNKNASIVNDTPVSDRNAREVLYMTSTAILKDVLYDISTAQSTVYVAERYALTYFNDEEQLQKTSETVPKSIYIFGKDEDRYFYGWFTGFDQRPTLDWLGSFGLK